MSDKMWCEKVDRNEASNTIRKFLKEKDITPIDMIAYLNNTLAFAIGEYNIKPKELFEKMESVDRFLAVCCSASFMINLVFIEKNEEET